jgi:hypothetical protein
MYLPALPCSLLSPQSRVFDKKAKFCAQISLPSLVEEAERHLEEIQFVEKSWRAFGSEWSPDGAPVKTAYDFTIPGEIFQIFDAR